MEKLKHNFWQLLIAVDQLINVLFGLIIFDESYADETLSSRAYRSSEAGYWYGKLAEFVINCLFFFDKDGEKRHCQLAYDSEVERKHIPIEMNEVTDIND